MVMNRKEENIVWTKWKKAGMYMPQKWKCKMCKNEHKEVKEITEIMPQIMGCTEHVKDPAVFKTQFKTWGN